MTENFWCVTASADHAARGLVEGIVQACHGKAAPLQRMRPGDGVVIYAPRESRTGGAPFQAFAAIGRIAPGAAWQADMGGGFLPWRRRMRWEPSHPAPIRPLLDQLAFLRGQQSWGMAFRYGLCRISQQDFQLIARAMGAEQAFALAEGAPY